MSSYAMRRTSPRGRVFPPVDRIYSDAASDSGAWLVTLANHRASFFHRYLGIGVTARSRVQRLLGNHRAAIAAEYAGRFDRANFFWRACLADIRAASRDDSVWEATPLPVFARSAQELREVLLLEVFVDTHAAFYNGSCRDVAAVTPQSRCFAHARCAAQILERLGADPRDHVQLLVPPVKLLAAVCKRDKTLEPAIEACEALLQRLPETLELQDELADLLVASARPDNDGKSEDAGSAAARMQHAIDRLEAARTRHPHNPTLYRALAQCHVMNALRLANLGELPQALAQARLAQKYDPHSHDARAAETRLRELLERMQGQIRKALEQIAAQPGSQLNAEGERMRAQLANALGPLQAVESSQHAVEVLGRYPRAVARRLWQDIGLPGPSDRWEERAGALVGALQQVLQSRPADAAGVKEAWRRVASGSVELAQLDVEPIEAFLRQRLLNEPRPTPSDASREFSVLKAPAPNSKRWETFVFWLIGPGDLSLKARIAAAATAVVLASTLYAIDRREATARDRAYAEVVEAMRSGSYERAMGAADAFLKARLARDDIRDSEVKALYQQAFTRWFTSAALNGSAHDQERIDRYRAHLAR